LQHNILNLNTSFNKELESAFNYSLFYKQKELVGGDFYSVFRQENAMYIIVADCTGHGVPGALMTILSYTILKQIIIDEKVSYPSDILKRMNTILINSFKDENGIYSNDGVAISLMKYDLGNSQISFSCAQQSVFILNNDLTVEELKFNSTPLNYKISEAYYETKQLNNIKGQKIIMFSDGIIDQKIEKSKLRIRKPGLIEIIKNRTNDKDHYKNSVLNLSGNAEQIDDMLLIELEIKIK
jgi:serine phosphatase RsbU (regulator of sigma subunit)